MVRSVSRKPMLVCTVSMVPTSGRSESSAIAGGELRRVGDDACPQTRQISDQQRRGCRRKEADGSGAGAADRHASHGQGRAAQAVGDQPARDRARPRPRRWWRRWRAWPPYRRATRAGQRQRGSSRRGRRRSTPTSRRAPTCGRGSRDWRAATTASRQALSAKRGSKGGAVRRLGRRRRRRISSAAASARQRRRAPA